MIRFVVSGDKQVKKRLLALPGKLQRKVLRTAARAAMRPALAAAKAAVNVKTGRLRKSLRLRAIPRKKDLIGFRVITASGWFTGDEYYAAFVEFGHKLGRRITRSKYARKDADTRKEVEGKHWIQGAYDATDQQARSLFIQEVRRGLDSLKGT